MKKMMVLMFVLGLASASYAQMGSPIWDAKIMAGGRADSAKSDKISKKIEQANQNARKQLGPTEIFQNANKALDKLAQQHAEYKEVLSSIKTTHQEILECLNIQRDRAEFEEQAILEKLEDIGPQLDLQLSKLEDIALRTQVKGILDHPYKFRGDQVIPFHKVLQQVAGFFNTQTQWGNFFDELMEKNK